MINPLKSLSETNLLVLVETILSKPCETITEKDQEDLYLINEELKEREKTIETRR